MGQAQRIIESILAEQCARAAQRERSVFSSAAYREEPLVLTGSQMASYLPERYREMRAIARSPEARFKTDAWLFRRQAAFMADWEDDLPFAGSFERDYPTYRIMSNRQLRGYFSWRTRLRRGQVERTCASFALVYLYELLNGVGWEAPEDGLRLIARFQDAYGGLDPEVGRRARLWAIDFAAYHGLDRALVAEEIDLGAYEDLDVLGDPERHPDARLALAVARRSGWRAGDDDLAGEHPGLLDRAVCSTWRELSRYFEKHRTGSLVDYFFGTLATRSRIMFEGAVFCDRPHPDAVWHLGEEDALVCVGGRWSHVSHRFAARRSTSLHALVSAIDASLRRGGGFGGEAAEVGMPKYMAAIVEREARAALAWEREGAARRVDIDLGKLSGIRAAASETCEALLTDEEREQEPACAPAPAPPVATAAAGPLSAAEAAWLAALAEGRDRAAALEADGRPEDMLVDAVNEKLYDLVGDTVVEFSDCGPALIDDYLDDVKGLLEP